MSVAHAYRERQTERKGDMRVATREAGGALIVDLQGPFPRSDDGRMATQDAVRDALAGHSCGFIIVFHEIDAIRATEIGLLLMWLRNAGAEMGALGAGRHVRIVSRSERIRSIMNAMDSPFSAFETEEEALSSLRA